MTLLAALLALLSLTPSGQSLEDAERERRETVEQYSRFAAQFNRELAGRYPFGALESVDASTSSVCDFFRYYGDQLEPLRIRLDSMKNQGTPAGFVKELIAAHTFLAGTACSRFNQSIRINFAPLDTAPRTSNPPRIWMLTDDFGRARSPHGIPFMDWRFGSPIALVVRWSEQTGLRPRTAQPEDDFTNPDSNSIRFGESGHWALMRFIESRRTERPYRPATRSGFGANRPDDSLSVYLGFSAPLVSSEKSREASRPHSSSSSRITEEMKNRAEHTRLIVMLTFETSPAGRPRRFLRWPAPFPRQAPPPLVEEW